jgi:hypothetical protein
VGKSTERGFHKTAAMGFDGKNKQTDKTETGDIFGEMK